MPKKQTIREQDLDKALSGMDTIEPSEKLVSRIMADAEEAFSPRGVRIFWPFGKIWIPAGVMAASVALGIYAGFVVTGIDQGDITDEIETNVLG